MASWHFLKAGKGFSWSEGGAIVSSFDDGLAFLPGEDGFSDAAAKAKAASLGAGVTAEYTGTPNWSARVEAEDRKAAASAELDNLLNPVAPADLVNAHFDELLAQLPDRADDVETARKAELAALEAPEE